MSNEPYRVTEIFDEITLPAALRARHTTKANVWGVIRVLAGRLRYTILDPPSETILTPDRQGLVLPQLAHFVTPLGPMRMRVEFYRAPPDLSAEV